MQTDDGIVRPRTSCGAERFSESVAPPLSQPAAPRDDCVRAQAQHVHGVVLPDGCVEELRRGDVGAKTGSKDADDGGGTDRPSMELARSLSKRAVPSRTVMPEWSTPAMGSHRRHDLVHASETGRSSPRSGFELPNPTSSRPPYERSEPARTHDHSLESVWTAPLEVREEIRIDDVVSCPRSLHSQDLLFNIFG